MQATIESFQRDVKASDVVSALQRDGAAIVREVVAPETMDDLLRLVTPDLETGRAKVVEANGGEYFGHASKPLFGLFARGPAFARELLLQPLLLEIADSVLGPNGDHYRVNVGGVMQVWPGGEAQGLHREMDGHQPFMLHDPERPEYILASQWAATDFTADNGATRIGIGSHRWAPGRSERAEEIAQESMPKGSVLFWLGKTLHGLGANRSTRPRTGFLFTLKVDWLTQEENQFIVVPPEKARALPERAQQLLGYRSSLGRGLNGWVQGRDCRNLLRPAGDGDPSGAVGVIEAFLAEQSSSEL